MIRAISGLVLLSWIFLPASVVAAIWTSEWRWVATGVGVALIGSFVGLLMVRTTKRAAGRAPEA